MCRCTGWSAPLLSHAAKVFSRRDPYNYFHGRNRQADTVLCSPFGYAAFQFTQSPNVLFHLIFLSLGFAKAGFFIT